MIIFKYVCDESQVCKFLAKVLIKTKDNKRIVPYLSDVNINNTKLIITKEGLEILLDYCFWKGESWTDIWTGN